MIRTFVLTLALLATAPVQAGGAADEADVAFDLGNRSYAHGTFEEALEHYFASYRLVANRNVLFNIARCYEQLSKFDEAYRYYNDLRSAGLSNADAQEVRRSLERIEPKVALLDVDSDPPGAEILVDRDDLGSRGQTPLTLALPAGAHRLRLKREGFHSAESQVALSRGHRTRQVFALERVVGRVSLTGAPDGAWVRESMSGPTLGFLPAAFSLAPGQRLLTVGAPGFVARQMLIDVIGDQTASGRVVLEPAPIPTGKVVVTSNRENALVTVDGRQAGFTPAVLALPEGTHRIEVSSPEVPPFDRSILVLRDSAQTLDADLRYTPPPIHAASKGVQSIDEAPASVSVISSEEIRAFGYTTVAEALQAVRGFFLLDDRQYQYVGTRGFLPPGDLNTRLLVLWNGHSMNDVWAGQGYLGRDLTVDLREVDHIEIVRGPGSALYGTGALFAVINIVPRDAIGAGQSVEATGSVGSLGAWGGHVAGTGRAGPASGTVSAAGYFATGAEFTTLGGGQLVAGLDGERGGTATANAHAGPWSLSALINLREKDIPNAPYGTEIGAPGTYEVDQRGFVEARYEHRLPLGDLFARAYYDGSRYRGYWVYAAPTGLETDSGGADWIGAEAQLRLLEWAGNHLTTGVEAQQQLRVYQTVFATANEPPLQAHARTVASAYVQDTWTIRPRLQVTASLRVDHYSDIDAVPLTPRLAVIARPYSAGITKLVAGTAFRAPTVYELYYQDYGVSQLPALHLNPETIASLELEHSHDLSQELRFTIDLYANWISQLITLEGDSSATLRCGTAAAPIQCELYQNTPGVTRAVGAEAELRWQPGRFVMVDLSYAYTTLDTTLAEVAAMVPHHVVTARAMFPLGGSGVRASAQGLYQSARAATSTDPGVGDVVLLNLGLSGDWNHFSYFAGVKNALDAHYALPTGSPQPPSTVEQYGRTFLLQLTAAY